MPHDHNHDHSCEHEHHDHEHIEETGPLDNLFSRINRTNGIVALNAAGQAARVFKPWHLRMDETDCLDSDADDQMIIRVTFTGSVKLRSILLKTGPGDMTPSSVRIFANADNLDFDDINDAKSTQDFDIAQGREIGEYTVKVAKFANVTSLTLFFPSSQGADIIRIYYIGLMGQWTELKNNPVITVYEAQANLADHEKIQGTQGNFFSLGQ